MKKKEKGDRVEEPGVGYKHIMVSTLDEQKDQQREYWASLSPEERFECFYQLMCRFYDFKESSLKGSKVIIDSGTS